MLTIGRTSWGHLCTFFASRQLTMLLSGGEKVCAENRRQVQCGVALALMVSSSPQENKLKDR